MRLRAEIKQEGIDIDADDDRVSIKINKDNDDEGTKFNGEFEATWDEIGGVASKVRQRFGGMSTPKEVPSE